MKSTLHTGSIAKAKTRTRAFAPVDEDLQIHQTLLAAVTAAPVMIALWAAACLLGALMPSGGPLALARGWLQAVTGM
jgi:hypothetical protein